MKLPLQITTRNLSISDAAIDNIKQKVKKLEQFSNHIIACRVMVEAPHRHKHQGTLYNVRIDLTVPGGELVVKRECHEDIYVAIRDAFDAAKRQLLSFSRKRRVVKTHAAALRVGKAAPVNASRAKISKLYSEEGFGFIETEHGEELYFARQHLMDADIDELEIGVVVRYSLMPGEQGRQAAAITLG